MNLNLLLNVQTDLLAGVELNPVMLIGTYIIYLLGYVALFVIKGIAIYTMAKRRKFDKLWMAFIPFLNFVLLGKLVGKVSIWGKKVNNIGLLLCIFTAVSTILGVFIDLGYYLYIIQEAFRVKFVFASEFVNAWVAQSGIVFSISYYSYLIIDIASTILRCWLIFLIFRMYSPQRAFIFSLISIFVPESFPIFLFIVRNNEVVTFEDFLRTRNRYYNQNPNGYGGFNQYGGYSQPKNNPSGTQNDIDPFPEFSNDKNGNSNSSQNNSGEDDLFS